MHRGDEAISLGCQVLQCRAGDGKEVRPEGCTLEGTVPAASGLTDGIISMRTEVKMAKTVLISEDGIIAMLRGLSEDALMEILSKTLVQGDTSPLTAEEDASYKKALLEREKGELINWRDLK